jgi:hypothetical protein
LFLSAICFFAFLNIDSAYFPYELRKSTIPAILLSYIVCFLCILFSKNFGLIFWHKYPSWIHHIITEISIIILWPLVCILYAVLILLLPVILIYIALPILHSVVKSWSLEKTYKWLIYQKEIIKTRPLESVPILFGILVSAPVAFKSIKYSSVSEFYNSCMEAVVFFFLFALFIYFIMYWIIKLSMIVFKNIFNLFK